LVSVIIVPVTLSTVRLPDPDTVIAAPDVVVKLLIVGLVSIFSDAPAAITTSSVATGADGVHVPPDQLPVPLNVLVAALACPANIRHIRTIKSCLI
jgi:hypothetical protein